MDHKKTFATVDEYIDCQPEQVAIALRALRSYIFEAAPDAAEMFNYDIPAYALVKDGKRDQQVMMAGYAHHVGFYPHPTTIEHFFEALKDYKRGKGSVQFPVGNPLPKELILRMMKYSKLRLSQSR